LQRIVDTTVAEGVVPSQVRAVLSAMFGQAVRWQLVATNPAKATTAPSRERPALTVPDAQHLRELVEVARGTQWEVPMLLACSTGMRRSEVLGVSWQAVDLDAGTLRVDQTLQLVDGRLVIADVKTARSRRTIPLSPPVVARLRQHRTEQLRARLALGATNDLDLVCTTPDGQPVSPNSFSNAAVRLGAKVGLEGMRLHDVRHGVATALAKAGVRPEVTSAILGHSSVGFTLTAYTHPDAEQLRAATAGLAGVFGT
jgi:integrase